MSISPGRHPVSLEGHLDEDLSRWKWLVKWFLAIPHCVVLIVLAFGAIFASIGAWFAILFTGKYPRSLFDYNVGVMRWGWRVGFYAFEVMGTDKYPPFSLQDDPDYPARLQVEYPDHLSRGLVLVKSWLLAIPHYIIIAFFIGGSYQVTTDQTSLDVTFPGLILVLALISVIILLFTGRYQETLFNLNMGLNRWVYRVYAYALLMTDVYPPFRLDPGPTEEAVPSAGPITQQPTPN